MWPLKALDVKFWLKTDVLLWVSLGCIHFSPALASMGLIAYVFQLWVWGEKFEESSAFRWLWWGVALCVGWNMCVIWMSGYWPWSVGVGGVSGVTMDVAGGLLEKEDEMGRMALNKVLIKLPLLLVAMAYGWQMPPSEEVEMPKAPIDSSNALRRSKSSWSASFDCSLISLTKSNNLASMLIFS